jgi:hypothetical protein
MQSGLKYSDKKRAAVQRKNNILCTAAGIPGDLLPHLESDRIGRRIVSNYEVKQIGSGPIARCF